MVIFHSYVSHQRVSGVFPGVFQDGGTEYPYPPSNGRPEWFPETGEFHESSVVLASRWVTSSITLIRMYMYTYMYMYIYMYTGDVYVYMCI